TWESHHYPSQTCEKFHRHTYSCGVPAQESSPCHMAITKTAYPESRDKAHSHLQTQFQSPSPDCPSAYSSRNTASTRPHSPPSVPHSHIPRPDCCSKHRANAQGPKNHFPPRYSVCNTHSCSCSKAAHATPGLPSLPAQHPESRDKDSHLDHPESA